MVEGEKVELAADDEERQRQAAGAGQRVSLGWAAPSPSSPWIRAVRLASNDPTPSAVGSECPAADQFFSCVASAVSTNADGGGSRSWDR